MKPRVMQGKRAFEIGVATVLSRELFV